MNFKSRFVPKAVALAMVVMACSISPAFARGGGGGHGGGGGGHGGGGGRTWRGISRWRWRFQPWRLLRGIWWAWLPWRLLRGIWWAWLRALRLRQWVWLRGLRSWLRLRLWQWQWQWVGYGYGGYGPGYGYGYGDGYGSGYGYGYGNNDYGATYQNYLYSGGYSPAPVTKLRCPISPTRPTNRATATVIRCITTRPPEPTFIILWPDNRFLAGEDGLARRLSYIHGRLDVPPEFWTHSESRPKFLVIAARMRWAADEEGLGVGRRAEVAHRGLEQLDPSAELSVVQTLDRPVPFDGPPGISSRPQ